jgi:hypothetical protein
MHSEQNNRNLKKKGERGNKTNVRKECGRGVASNRRDKSEI